MTRATLLVLLMAGCGLAGDDVCERAAQHRAECLGTYVTPPVCDPAAEAAARSLVALDCAQLVALQMAGKADGTFCDWFSEGCTEDEVIFTGPACQSDADCSAGTTCLARHCFAGVGSDDFSAIMDRTTQTRESAGGYTRLLNDNAEARALRDMLMDGALRSIHLVALFIEADAIGYSTAAHLAQAAGRGVEVRVIVDATTQYDAQHYAVLDVMRDAGVQVLPYNPAIEWAALRWQIGINENQRLHEKLLIVDGEQVVMGGRNVGGHYLAEGRWRDTDVYLSGPGVADVQQMFLASWDQFSAWELKAGCPQNARYGYYCPDGTALARDPRYYSSALPLGAASTRPIYSNPRAQRTPLGYLTYLNAVRSARQSILITNAYFVPPRRLRKHLKEAVARGVRVVVVTNSKGSTDAWWMYYASLNYYKELIEAGIEIRQYRGSETMHAKTLVVDGELAIIGSYNLDPRSAGSNSESLLLVRGDMTAGDLGRAFQDDSANSDVASADISFAEMAKARSFRIAEPVL